MTTDRLHQPIVAAAVEQLTRTRTTSAGLPVAAPFAELASVCAQSAETLELGEKWRWQLHEAARLTAAYLRFLQPPSGWWRAEALPEAPLIWTCGTRTFADVVVTLRRGSTVWTRHSSGLPRRLATAGRDVFGDGFVGARLAVVAAPARSLLVTAPTGAPATPADSELWFHPAPLAPIDLAVAAAGGQVQP